ncbi:zinc finger domain-containing protein [Streptacidiphilus anmyonensis]|uniref:zinc finger domain-containing protein n=1 Tax=Streptacidiphilus anmyonensis TaxID=405782 RepID=UPI0005A93652|nr:hypothetical protein [Streptacidiphilus anmyonensis]
MTPVLDVDTLSVSCPQCGARATVMCGGRSQPHPLRRAAARDAAAGHPRLPDDSGLPGFAFASAAAWDFEDAEAGWSEPDPEHVGALGPDGESLCMGCARWAEYCPVCARACWLCRAPAGSACTPLLGSRRLHRQAHPSRFWHLDAEDVDAYLRALTVACPICEAHPGRLCHSAGADPAQRRLRRHAHHRRAVAVPAD